jgi:hypothetical protein
MANQLHEFTVQEAQNFSAYTSYEFEKQTMDGSAKEYTDWAAAAIGPAKHLVVYATTGGQNDDLNIALKVDDAYGDWIELGAENLPLTISGLLVDRIKIDSTSGDNDIIGVLSFH